ncbi:putative sodium symporter protein [Denitrovibrio acetiphilus DSM 12809]|uniref:Putative sodium symporter protein n=1 Tax=Denitrovibrio acetiphilus (strain DSM 12809 / NBRC 114555 / N2460) TaxID=522772 RepID=D4H7M3_DENA2|nr:cation acetate symporter [Denitrovibrio acetiphilus]ADD68022.1 putative sodium symporter protein [Denitrovibrio acetiphilus DSM 12809]
MNKYTKMFFTLVLVIGSFSGAYAAAGEELFQLEKGFKLLPAIIMIAFIGLYLTVGWMMKVKTTEGYWVAERNIGAVGNGMAIASDWMSAASFMGVAGLLYLKGFFGLGYIIGWTGGYVLLLTLTASQLRRFGKYTIPEFLGDRYNSHGIRMITAVVTVIIAITYSTAQFKGIALISGWIFGMNYVGSVFFAAGIVLVYMLMSGQKGVTKNQQIQYVVLITGFLLPLFIIFAKYGAQIGTPGILPQIEYGAIISNAATATGEGAHWAANYTAPWANGTFYQFFALAFTLMVGTAGLPHILVRFYTVTDEDVARKSVVYGLFFIGILYWSSPAYAALGQFFNPAGGKAVADVIILSAPERAGLGLFFMGYLASGALAAGLSTVAGLMVAGAAAIAHDWYATIFRPDSSEQEKLMAARIFTAVLVCCVIITALKPPALIAQIVAMAFAIAGSAIFPAIVLGVWYGKSNKYGAMAGMLVGLIGAVVSMVGWINNVEFFGATGIMPATSSALILAPLNFITNIVVSNMTAASMTAKDIEEGNKVLKVMHNIID